VAAQFDAATDRVSRATAPNPTAGLTFCAWVRIDVDQNEWSTFLRLWGGGGGSTTLTAATPSDGVTPRVFSPSNTTGAVGTAMTVGVWRFLAYTYNPTGNVVTHYGGTEAGEVLTSVTAAVPPGITPEGLTLAGRDPGDATEWLRGTIAHARLWSGAPLDVASLTAERDALTPVTTANLWADWPLTADLTDASGNARHLSAGSTAVTYVTGPDIVPEAETVTGTATGAGGGSGTASGVRERVGTAVGSGGGSGTVAGVRERVGTATGSGGGEGLILVATEVAAPEAASGGWDTLLSIAQESRAEARASRSQPPTACPNDGEPLSAGIGGALRCRFDGWTWRGGYDYS